MSKRVAILHYASPPVVGGVETTIAHHARGLANLGYLVRVISGDGAPFDDRVEVRINPLLGSREPHVLATKTVLDQGSVSESFNQLVSQQEAILQEALENCDICIAHNIHTLNKNLTLTAALHRFKQIPLIAWCHDLAWTNPLYQAELHNGYPWDLLRLTWPNTRYVTISSTRQNEIARLFRVPQEQITVVPPGVDVAAFLQWTDQTRILEQRLNLLNADLIFLLPARITRRKNIELALHILHALTQHDYRDIRLLISGPPGPHNPTNPGYLGELLELRRSLGLEDKVHFLYELDIFPDDITMSNLYQLADALLFPSLQEGFGIPILEAGLIGLPIFCSDLEPFHQTGREDIIYFRPEHDTPESIATMLQTYFTGNPRHRLKVRVRQQHRWDAIIQDHLIPILEAP